ncbi:Alpha/Beta hydrolase protein [Leptodontidium sp. 2 PMI_412]|nr:Alpha/Beta hydrolase protein [Leptodontidium sp. 2 PMI_412]
MCSIRLLAVSKQVNHPTRIEADWPRRRSFLGHSKHHCWGGTGGVNVRFKEVPNGVCETNANVKSFAGYVDVSPTQHVYFWMFEARQNAAQSPLTVRLDGSPGASSMNGSFSEIGPCSIDSAGHVVDNPNSWTTMSIVLFVDQPATVGFSFTTLVNGTVNPRTAEIVPQQCTEADPMCRTYSSPDTTLTPNSTVDAGKVFYQVTQGFMGAFPQYSANGVRINGTVRIPLKSISIEGGFMDTQVQFGAYYNYSVDPGNPYDIALFNDTLQRQLFTKYCSAAENFCVSNNDIRQVAPDPSPPTEFVTYLNLSIQTFLAFNSTGNDSRTGELVTESMRSLLRQGVTAVAANVGAPGWAHAGFIPGETKQADGFSFTQVYLAGHAFVFNQPEATLRIQHRAITGMDIASGMVPMVPGPATVQTKVTPPGSIYDPTTHVPVLSNTSAAVTENLSVKADVVEESSLHPLAGMTAKKIGKMANGAALRQ